MAINSCISRKLEPVPIKNLYHPIGQLISYIELVVLLNTEVILQLSALIKNTHNFLSQFIAFLQINNNYCGSIITSGDAAQSLRNHCNPKIL